MHEYFATQDRTRTNMPPNVEQDVPAASVTANTAADAVRMQGQTPARSVLERFGQWRLELAAQNDAQRQGLLDRVLESSDDEDEDEDEDEELSDDLMDEGGMEEEEEEEEEEEDEAEVGEGEDPYALALEVAAVQRGVQLGHLVNDTVFHEQVQQELELEPEPNWADWMDGTTAPVPPPPPQQQQQQDQGMLYLGVPIFDPSPSPPPWHPPEPIGTDQPPPLTASEERAWAESRVEFEIRAGLWDLNGGARQKAEEEADVVEDEYEDEDEDEGEGEEEEYVDEENLGGGFGGLACERYEDYDVVREEEEGE
ncbi:MAG: hypothetical protein Q9160_003146 [Pyrenula sp. 1 TL-2023]